MSNQSPIVTAFAGQKETLFSWLKEIEKQSLPDLDRDVLFCYVLSQDLTRTQNLIDRLRDMHPDFNKHAGTLVSKYVTNVNGRSPMLKV